MIWNKQEKESKQKPSIESEKNLSFLRHIFAQFTLQPTKLKTKQRLKQEFLARTNSYTALNRLTKMLIESVINESRQIVRIDLKPSTNTVQLLNSVKKFIPLDRNSKHSVRMKLQSKTFSPNKVNAYLKHQENTHNAVTIPINDFASFLVEQVLLEQQQMVYIPSLTNQNSIVTILGVTLKSQPTAIIFFVDGTTGGIHPPKRLKQRPFSPTPRLAI